MTITEIAKKVGVSIGTVDRVLHNRGKVSPATREKIEKAIAEYKYTPNPIAQHLKKNRDYCIGVLIPVLNSESEYWQSLFDGIRKAEQELSVFSIRVVYIEFDRTIKGSCIQAGKKMLDLSIDALIMAPVVPDEAYEVLNMFSHIPYIFVDSPLPHSKPLFTLAQNPFKAGYCAARVMKMLEPQGECFVCIQLHSDAYNLKERSRGFMAYFARYSDADVHHKSWDWDNREDSIFEFLDSVFAKYPSIDGFFIPNNAVFMLHSYLIAKNIEKTFSIIGFDLQKNNVDCLLKGNIDMVISQQQLSQGYQAVSLLYKKMILNQSPDTDTDIGIEIYYRENLAEFIMG